MHKPNMYDPFVENQIPFNQPPTDSYWNDKEQPITTKALESDIHTDVLIIGAGYTGLSCAIELANAGIKNITVIDANQIGWGCSSRNAGFVLPGSGRLSYKELESRFGTAQTLKLHDQFISAIDLLETRISSLPGNADKTEHGYLKLAHSKSWFEKLNSSAAYLQSNFNYDVEVITKNDFNKNFVDHQHVYGAIRYKNGFGINPLKLVNHYAQLAIDMGVNIYTHSPANEITKSGNNTHHVITPKGSIKTNKLVIATNGYTPKSLNTPLNGKVLPVLTSVIVTRPLTPSEIEQSNFKTHQVMMDTRELKYYYRLLPDNRILFGGRSAITGKAAANPKYQQRLLQELQTSFVGLDEVTIDYGWSGWISVAFDQMPHIYKTDDDIFYATGYCGSGVSFSAWAGKQLADLISEQESSSPLMTELPSFPFAPFRRMGQRFFYQYGRLKDWAQ